MAFQSAVAANMPLGVVGEIFDDGPHRAQPFRLTGGANNVVGRAYTIVAGTGEAATAGQPGTQRFGGISINPKNHALVGAGFAPSLTVPDGELGELLSEGSVVVALPAAANVGDVVYFTNATGVITTTAPGASAPANSTLIVGAYVDRFQLLAAGLGVITLSPNSRTA